MTSISTGLPLAERARIEDLLSAYVLSLDVDDTEAMVALFTEDAEFCVYGRVYAGHAGLREMLAEAPKGLHLAGRALIAAAGDGARVRQQLVFYPASGERPRLAIYDDDLRRDGDQWRFRRRSVRFMKNDGTLR